MGKIEDFSSKPCIAPIFYIMQKCNKWVGSLHFCPSPLDLENLCNIFLYAQALGLRYSHFEYVNDQFTV